MRFLNINLKYLIFGYLNTEIILLLNLNLPKILKFNNLKPISFLEAVKANQIQTIKHLITVKEESIYPEIFRDAINIACMAGHLQVVQYLLSLGIKPNNNAIDLASIAGHLEVVKLLYNNNFLPNKHTAYRARMHIKIVNYLAIKGYVDPCDFILWNFRYLYK